MKITGAQLRHIIEEEFDAVMLEQSVPDVDMGELQKQVKQLAQKTKDDKQLDEAALSAVVIGHLIAGGILALPMVIKYIGEAVQYLGKGINFASRIFKGKSKTLTDDLEVKIKNGQASTGDLVTTMGKILENHTAHWLHEKYLNFFTTVFGGAAGFLYFYKTGKKMDSATKEKIGEVFFYALVIYLCAAALSAGINGFAEFYGKSIITNSEFVLGMIKVDELFVLVGMEDVILSVLAVLSGKKVKDVMAQQKKKIDDQHHSDQFQKFADQRDSQFTIAKPTGEPLSLTARTGVSPKRLGRPAKPAAE